MISDETIKKAVDLRERVRAEVAKGEPHAWVESNVADAITTGLLVAEAVKWVDRDIESLTTIVEQLAERV